MQNPIEEPMDKKTASAYVSVRITRDQYEALQKVATLLPGGNVKKGTKNSVNGLVQDSVQTYLDCEAAEWIAAAERIAKKSGRKSAA